MKRRSDRLTRRCEGLGHRWGAAGGTACRAPTCSRKPALRAIRRGGAVGAPLGARHAMPRPVAGNRRFARHGEAAPLGRRWGHGMPCPDLQPETGASCASRATARRRRWGHGMPCPDLQPETGASCASRATARRRRWGAVGGTAYRAPTCNRKPALRAPRQAQTIPDKPSSALIRRIRADSCSIPTPETCAVWSGATCYNCGIQANGQCCTRRLC